MEKRKNRMHRFLFHKNLKWDFRAKQRHISKFIAAALLLTLTLECGYTCLREKTMGRAVLVPYSAMEVSSESSIDKFKNFILENGMKISGIYVYSFDTGLENVNFYSMVNGDAVMLSLSYPIESLSSSQVQFTSTALLYLTGYEKQQPGTYYFYHLNTATMKTGELSFGAGVNLDPTTYTVDADLTFVDIRKNNNSSSDAAITDSFVTEAKDSLNTIFELFSEILKKDSIGLTLKDYGFMQYQIAPYRTSRIRGETGAAQQTDLNKTKETSTVTPGMRNALQSAKDYLDAMSFSRKGLIEQLEYEGYSSSEAEYAVEHCGADWNEQACDMARDYLEEMAFSRSSLIEQLEFEGFTHSQAVYGVDKAYR